MFFNLFQRTAVQVIPTDTGSHGVHRYALFGESFEDVVIGRIQQLLKTSPHRIDRNTFVMTDPFIRGVVYEDTMITAFPYAKGDNYHHCQTHAIHEWKHSRCLEAIIEAKHQSDCRIVFFATDYAINKNIYKQQKNASVNLIGLIYFLETFNSKNSEMPMGTKLSESFCGFLPGPEKDTIDFVGHITNIKEYALHGISGFMIALKITPDFVLDFFIAHVNLKIELTLNQQVCGLAWIQGTLEK
jgi:hypothetical protein